MKRAKQRTPHNLVMLRWFKHELAKRIRRKLQGQVICGALQKRAVAEIMEAVSPPVERITITPVLK